MAEITRQMRQPNTTQYIAPGVQGTTANTIARLGQAALDIDEDIANRTLEGELNDMLTIYETNSVALGNEAVPLSEADASEIATARDRIGRLQRAVQQGGITHDQFRMAAEGAVRAAMARRPGLSTELRQLASGVLGEDVVGAGREFLAAREAAMLSSRQAEQTAATARQEQRGRQIRDALKIYSADNAVSPLDPSILLMTDTELADLYDSDTLFQGTVNELATVKAEAERSQLMSSAATAEINRGRRAAVVQASERVHGYRSGLRNAAREMQKLLADGYQPEDIPKLQELRLQGKTALDDVRLYLNANVVDIGDTTVNNYMRQLDDDTAYLQAFEDRLAGGDAQRAVEGFVASVAHDVATSDETIARFAAMRQVLGSDWAMQISAGTEEQKRAIGIAVQASTVQNFNPKLVVANSSGAISSITNHFSQTPADEQLQGIEGASKLLRTIVNGVINVPAGDFQISNWAGPTGGAARLTGNQGKLIADKLPDADRESIGNRLLVAHRRSLDAAKLEWQRRYPNSDATFELRPDGSFIQTTNETEKADAARFQATILNGSNLINSATTFLRKPPAEIINLLNTVAVPQVQPVTRSTTTTATSGGSDWYNNPNAMPEFMQDES